MTIRVLFFAYLREWHCTAEGNHVRLCTHRQGISNLTEHLTELCHIRRVITLARCANAYQGHFSMWHGLSP